MVLPILQRVWINYSPSHHHHQPRTKLKVASKRFSYTLTEIMTHIIPVMVETIVPEISAIVHFAVTSTNSFERDFRHNRDPLYD